MISEENRADQATETRNPQQEYDDRHATISQVHRVITQGISDVISDATAIVKQLPPPIRDAVAMQILRGASDRLNFELDAGNEAYKRMTQRNLESQAAEVVIAQRTRY